MAPDLSAALRALAEEILREATGAERVVRLCPYCGSDRHGQPRLVGVDWQASLSYTHPPNSPALVALAWGSGPIGVDIEHFGGSLYDAEAEQSGSLQEWTRIEALAKAAGIGLRDWPRVTLPDLPTRVLDLPRGFVGTLAGEGEVRLAGPGAASP